MRSVRITADIEKKISCWYKYFMLENQITMPADPLQIITEQQMVIRKTQDARYAIRVQPTVPEPDSLQTKKGRNRKSGRTPILGNRRLKRRIRHRGAPHHKRSRVVFQTGKCGRYRDTDMHNKPSGVKTPVQA